MTFTRQDFITFAVGAGAAVAIVLGQALITLDSGTSSDMSIWARNLATGLGAALGRYLITQLAQRGFAGSN